MIPLDDRFTEHEAMLELEATYRKLLMYPRPLLVVGAVPTALQHKRKIP